MKILLFSETIAGSGHFRAAENLARGIQTIYPNAEIKTDTLLSKVSPLLEKWSSAIYMKTIEHAPPLWGWAYRHDREWSLLGKQLISKISAGRLKSYFESEQPDIVVTTHAFCLGGLSELKRCGKLSFRLGAAPTDYCIHPFWIFDEVDVYFVGADSIKAEMMASYRVPPEKIHVTGIPIDPSFEHTTDRQAVRRQYGVQDFQSLILVTGGGLGLSPYSEILRSLMRVREPIFIVLVMGANPKGREQIAPLIPLCPHPVLILDYVENMREWMQASDLLIGKPGGLTVSEAMACGLPMVIYRPLPGQEVKNSQFLLEQGAALMAEEEEELKTTVERLCGDKTMADRIRYRVAGLGKPDSSRMAGRILVQIAKN